LSIALRLYQISHKYNLEIVYSFVSVRFSKLFASSTFFFQSHAVGPAWNPRVAGEY